MNVEYVTIQFPEPSETFATNEVRVLSSHGMAMTVHGLRRRHPRAAQLLEERGLSGLPTTHNSLGSSVVGVLAALVRPRLLLQALGWILRSNRRNPRDLGLSLVLVPRAFEILSGLERRRPDVVHMYWGHFPTLVGYLVQRRLPATVTSMSIVAYDLEREFGGAIDVARRADVIRTHARVNRPRIADFTGVSPERINIIYNGVDLARLERIRAAHPKVRQRIVAVGRLMEKKGMGEVLEAFAQVRSRWADATLLVLGDGPDRRRLEGLSESLHIGEAVRFLGHVAHERAIEEIAQAEVLLLLSRSEGERLPNVVKEGMACGCVCVTTPTPGISELVEHGVSGFVVPTGDVRAASSVVDEVFSGGVDVATLTAKAGDHIRQAFDLDRTALRYERLWSEAIERQDRHAMPGGNEAAPSDEHEEEATHRRRERGFTQPVPASSDGLRARSTVLMYHDVVGAASPDASGFPGAGAASYKVDPGLFEQHLEAIGRYEGAVAPIASVAPGSLADQWRLTFDDGGVSAVSPIADMLEARGWRGMFFITTDRIGTPGFLTAAHVRELHTRGHGVGSHSCSHPKRMSTCTRDGVRAEWRESVAILSDILEKRVVHASVPNGAYSRTVAEEAAGAGIEVLYTSDPTLRRVRVAGCLVVGRYAVRATTSAAWVGAVVAGERAPRYRQWLAWHLKGAAKSVAAESYDRVRQQWQSRRRA